MMFSRKRETHNLGSDDHLLGSNFWNQNRAQIWGDNEMEQTVGFHFIVPSFWEPIWFQKLEPENIKKCGFFPPFFYVGPVCIVKSARHVCLVVIYGL